MAGVEVNQAALKPKIKNGGRRSIAAPMHKLIHRFSGIPSQSSSHEKPLKTRLSFQSWKRRRSIVPWSNQDCQKVAQDDDDDDDNDADSENRPVLAQLPHILPTLVPLPSHKFAPRESLKRAPLAEPEEVILSDSKKPKLLLTGNHRLSRFSAKPIKAHYSLRKSRATGLP